MSIDLEFVDITASLPQPPRQIAHGGGGASVYRPLWHQFMHKAGPVAADGYSDWVGFTLPGSEGDRKLLLGAGSSLTSWAERTKQPNKVQFRVFENTPGEYILWARWAKK